MAIICTDEEKMAVSSVVHQRDLIYRMVEVINELEARIEALENE
jgi:hypothetical protein|tara:strand:- start:11541 stop:11672 length:132 start_codon:yes stop_codon:yes gene_type:complete